MPRTRSVKCQSSQNHLPLVNRRATMSNVLKCSRQTSVSLFALSLLSVALFAGASPAVAQQSATPAQLSRHKAIETCIARGHAEAPGTSDDAARQRNLLYLSCMSGMGQLP